MFSFQRAKLRLFLHIRKGIDLKKRNGRQLFTCGHNGGQTDGKVTRIRTCCWLKKSGGSLNKVGDFKECPYLCTIKLKGFSADPAQRTYSLRKGS